MRKDRVIAKDIRRNQTGRYKLFLKRTSLAVVRPKVETKGTPSFDHSVRVSGDIGCFFPTDVTFVIWTALSTAFALSYREARYWK